MPRRLWSVAAVAVVCQLFAGCGSGGEAGQVDDDGGRPASDASIDSFRAEGSAGGAGAAGSDGASDRSADPGTLDADAGDEGEGAAFPDADADAGAADTPPEAEAGVGDAPPETEATPIEAAPEAGPDSACGPCASGLCLDSGICAACESGSECASGVCTNHDCEHCLNDNECAEGHVCGTSICAAGCTIKADCPGNFDCCSGHCVDTTRDVEHCSACGTVCANNQFCGTSGGATSCSAVAIANLCSNPATTSLINPDPTFAPDIVSNKIIQDALVAKCSSPPSVSTITQDTPGAINPVTGQPVAGGGNLITVAGGAYVSKLVAYLDQAGLTPVYLIGTADNYQYWARATQPASTDTLVAELPIADSGETHDLFMVETVRDPKSGTFILIAFGQHAGSTNAAARFVAENMLANPGAYPKAWYVYEWTAASDAGPDTFALKGSGP